MEIIATLLIIYGLLFPLVYLNEVSKNKKEIFKEIITSKVSNNRNHYDLSNKYNVSSHNKFCYQDIQLTTEEKKVNYIFCLFFPVFYTVGFIYWLINKISF